MENYTDISAQPFTVSVPVPATFTAGWYPVAGRFVRLVGGYWTVYRTDVSTLFLWLYPPLTENYDMRNGTSYEHFEDAGPLLDQFLVDTSLFVPGQSNPWTYSWMPAPNASPYVQRQLGVPDRYSDVVGLQSSYLPIEITPRARRNNIGIIAPVAAIGIIGLMFLSGATSTAPSRRRRTA